MSCHIFRGEAQLPTSESIIINDSPLFTIINLSTSRSIMSKNSHINQPYISHISALLTILIRIWQRFPYIFQWLLPGGVFDPGDHLGFIWLSGLRICYWQRQRCFGESRRGTGKHR